MFTSRAEQRLKLRIDNADARLSETAFKIGLLDDNRHSGFVAKMNRQNELRDYFRKTTISARSDGYAAFVDSSSIALDEPVNLAQLARRPEVTAEQVSHLLPSQLREASLPEEILTVVTDLKYEGYLSAQENTARRLERAVNRKIPGAIEYSQLPGLSNEMAERLSRVRPQTIGQAMRIPGLTPAALSLLTIHVELLSRQSVR
jgi:NAD/FAD-utilizing enzyme apparently involved in cell division